jgi:hypothetical protein
MFKITVSEQEGELKVQGGKERRFSGRGKKYDLGQEGLRERPGT